MPNTNPSKFLALSAAIALLTACSTSDQSVPIDGNANGYRITCQSMPPFASYADCDSRAAHICANRGYKILSDKNGDPRSGSIWNMGSREIVARCN